MTPPVLDYRALLSVLRATRPPLGVLESDRARAMTLADKHRSNPPMHRYFTALARAAHWATTHT